MYYVIIFDDFIYKVQGVHTLLLHCYGLCKERWTYNDTLLGCYNDTLLDC